MYRIISLLLVTLLTSGFLNAQRILDLDSLKRALHESQDTSRVETMISLANGYRFSNLDSSSYYAEQGLELSRQIGYLKGEAICLGYKALSLYWMGNYPQALELAFEGINIMKDVGGFRGSRVLYLTVAEVYFDLKNFEKAMEFLRLSGSVYRYLKLRNAYTNLQIGEVMIELGHLDSALVYLDQSIVDFQLDNRSVDPLVYIALGNVEAKRGRLDSAMSYYNYSIALAEQNHEIRAITQSFLQLAQIHRQNNLDSAIYFTKRSLTLADSINQRKVVVSSAQLLADLYEPVDSDLALKYYKKANAVKESMYGAGNLQAIQAVIDKEEERQVALQEAEEEFQTRIRTNAFLGSSFTLIVIALLLYRNNRVQKKSKRKTEIAYERLQNTQNQLIHSEKMASLGELTAGIAHEIQNPLNFVNNFSDVNKELVDELEQEIEKGDKEEIRAILQDLRDNEEKVTHHGKRAEGIVKSMLQHSRGTEGQKERIDINGLCDEYLRLAYHGFRAKDQSFNCDYKLDLDSHIPKIEVVPQDIGRVLLNLINNAFQAIKGEEKPEVICTTRSTPPLRGDKGGVQITISDNGPGIPKHIRDKIFQPFFTTKATGEGTGLGLSLSYDIVTKGHGGKLSVKTEPGKGSEFIVELPVG